MTANFIGKTLNALQIGNRERMSRAEMTNYKNTESEAIEISILIR